jgi:hypothetical protein
MQVQTNNDKTKNTATKQFNLGDTVTWKSHANGQTTRKMGKIIAVISPSKDGSTGGLRGLPKKLYIDLLRDNYGYSRDAARQELDKGHYYSWYEELLASKYKLKFSTIEGMYRDEYHYLVEVDRGEGRKPYLYHPRTNTLSLAD